MDIQLNMEIGGGGNGTVYRGRDLDLDRDVAVKFFDNSFDPIKAQVQAHAAALKQIRCEHVVKVLGVEMLTRPGKKTAELALVMDYVAGQSFADWLANKPSLDDVRKFASGLFRGLDAFHLLGLAHGDLHQGNVKIEDGECRLIDPAAQEPSMVLSSATFGNLLSWDLRNAHDILRAAMATAGAGRTALVEFNDVFRQFKTVGELKSKWEEAMMQTDEHPSGEVDGVLEAYEAARHAISLNSRVELNSLQKSAIRQVGPAFTKAQKRLEAGEFDGDADDRGALLLLEAAGPLVALAAAIAEVAPPSEYALFRDLERILMADWPRSGLAHLTQLPRTAFYLAFHIVGAAAAFTRRPDAVAALLSTPIYDASTRDSRILWTTSDLTGWPEGPFGGNAVDAWQFTNKLFSKVPLLGSIFPTEMDYQVGLCALSITLTVAEFSTAPKEQLKQLATTNVSVSHPQAAPVWLFSKPDVQSRAWGLCRGSSFGALRSAGIQGSAARDELEQHWPLWLRALAQGWRGGRLSSDLAKLFPG